MKILICQLVVLKNQNVDDSINNIFISIEIKINFFDQTLLSSSFMQSHKYFIVSMITIKHNKLSDFNSK